MLRRNAPRYRKDDALTRFLINESSALRNEIYNSSQDYL
jgi:hypothetical protein